MSSYNYLFSTDGLTFKTKYYSTSSSSSKTWAEDPTTSIVFNINKNQWTTTSNDLTVSEGPTGSEGIKSLYIQSDRGIKYYTLTEKSLDGLSLDQGITQGFGDGIPLPESIKDQRFSVGAKAYSWIMDVTQPTYSIRKTHIVFKNNDDLHPVYTCATVSSYCSTTTSTLENAILNKAWYQNIGKNASIRLESNTQASIQVYDAETKATESYNLGYDLIQTQTGTPKHIVFKANDNVTQEILKDYFSVGDSQLALYEYDNKVVIGTYTQAIRGLKSTQYSYNKIAINDILTKWNPSRNPVLE